MVAVDAVDQRADQADIVELLRHRRAAAEMRVPTAAAGRGLDAVGKHDHHPGGISGGGEIGLRGELGAVAAGAMQRDHQRQSAAAPPSGTCRQVTAPGALPGHLGALIGGTRRQRHQRQYRDRQRARHARSRAGASASALGAGATGTT